MSRTARLQLSARCTGGLRPTQARLVTRDQPERVAVGRVGTPHAAPWPHPTPCLWRDLGRLLLEGLSTCIEERGLRSSRKADGGGVSGSSGVKDDSNRLAISAAPMPVMAGEAPVGLRLRPQYP